MFSIPLPPLPEQKAIVKTVNQLMAEVDQLEAQTKTRIELRQDFIKSSLRQLTTADSQSEWNKLKPQFTSFFDSTESIDKLKAAILQLAVQGKLTKQWREENRDVESASVLLERIKEEKASLIKEKKIRKEKPLPEITKEEIPFELPEGWVWCKFGELIHTMTNGIYKKSEFYKDSGIISLRMYNIQHGKIDFRNCRRLEVSDKELGKYKLEENDLLINRVNSYELIGKTAIIPSFDEDLVFESMNIRTRLIFKDKISTYINRLLQTQHSREYLMFNSKQAIGQASINQNVIGNLLISLPPVREQYFIVQTINKLINYCDQMKTEIENRNTLSKDFLRSSIREVMEKTESLT